MSGAYCWACILALDVIAIGGAAGGHHARQCAGAEQGQSARFSPDVVIEGVARTGGLMGVAALSAFMMWGGKDAAEAAETPVRSQAQASLSRYVDEFDYLKKLVGVDHIGLGTDYAVTLAPVAAIHAGLRKYPLEMMNKADENRICRWFRERLRPEQCARRNGAPRVHRRRDREGFWRQLDARLWAGVEFVKAPLALDRSASSGRVRIR